MSLKSSKELARSFSEKQAIVLQSAHTGSNELNFSNPNTVLLGAEIYKYSKNYDEIACSSKVLTPINHHTNDKAISSETNKSLLCQCDDFHTLKPDKITKCKHCHNSSDTMIDSQFCESSKTNKLFRNCDILPEVKSKYISALTLDHHTTNVSQDDNLSRSKNSDNRIEEGVLSYEPVEKSQIKHSSTLKKTDTNQPIQMKTKLRSMWNNVKYGWRVKREVNLKVDSAVWLLGRCYHNKLNEASSHSQDVTKQLKLDLLSKIWLTYRINFQRIPGTEFVSDSGWGCMLRCGQMMMAQALVCHFLKRDWRIASDQPKETKTLYKTILRWFGDSLSDASPFSLHNLVSLGVSYGRKAGDWYGPTHVGQVLRDALIIAQQNHFQLKDVCMYVALDGIVFKQDIEDLCHRPFKRSCQNVSTEISRISDNNLPPNKSTIQANVFTENSIATGADNLFSADTKAYMIDYDESCPSYSQFGPPSFNTAQNVWRSLVLFVSVRLGNDRINPFYIPCLKSLLAYEHCIGIIGGRPKHALYFVGWQDDKLIHMDPHACQPAVDVEKEDFNEKSFHSSSIRTMSFTEMDPSCAIGFYFRVEEDFRHFIDKFSEITAPMKRNLDYPVFALSEGRRRDIEEVDFCNAHAQYSFSNTSNTSVKEEDDYILL